MAVGKSFISSTAPSDMEFAVSIILFFSKVKGFIKKAKLSASELGSSTSARRFIRFINSGDRFILSKSFSDIEYFFEVEKVFKYFVFFFIKSMSSKSCLKIKSILVSVISFTKHLYSFPFILIGTINPS